MCAKFNTSVFLLLVSTAVAPLKVLVACLVGVPGGAKVQSVRRRAGQPVVHMEVPPGTFLVELEGVDSCRKNKSGTSTKTFFLPTLEGAIKGHTGVSA